MYRTLILTFNIIKFFWTLQKMPLQCVEFYEYRYHSPSNFRFISELFKKDIFLFLVNEMRDIVPFA